MEIGQMGCNFCWELVLSISLNSNIKKWGLHHWRTVYLHLNFPVSFCRLFFVHFNRKWKQPEGNLNNRLNKAEHKFENIQITLDFLSVLKLRDHFKWRANKNEHGEEVMLIRTFVLREKN